MGTLYDDPVSCNKCGERNTISVVDTTDGVISECGTKCTVCGFEDYWAYGFFESGEGLCKKYSFNDQGEFIQHQ